MTSNIGSRRLFDGMDQDSRLKESTKRLVTDDLRNHFKPEFLNRFDAIINFNELAEEHLLVIVDLMLDELNEMVKENEIEMTVTDEAKEKLVKMGYDKRFGARPLRRVIQDKIEDQLTDLILEEESVGKVIAKVADDAIAIQKA